MKELNLVYIALGSNKDDRFKNLQDATDFIFERIGLISNISKVYNTPAIGFKEEENTEDFLNACIAIKTELSADKTLKVLQAIEVSLGRSTKTTEHYESRTIDLDILFFNEEIFNSEFLIVPHPRLKDRKFVLQPLSDIAPNFIHPEFKLSISELSENSHDQSLIEAIDLRLENPIKKFNFSKYNYLAIEGNIGAGKTSLAHKIANDFNAKLILERFADNAFLPKFYQEPKRYAFTLEMSFLADRYQQISDDLSQLDLFKDFIVSDYYIFKSLIFSKITLPDDEFMLYRKLFYLMYKDITKPNLYIYLYQNTSRLQENIKKRGRDYEQEIEDNYLEKINSGYLEFLKNQTEIKVKIIDISNRDFVGRRQDYLWLLRQISQ